MFKNTRLSAMLAAVLFSVTAASALVSAPAFADAPAAGVADRSADRGHAAQARDDHAAARHAGKVGKQIVQPLGRPRFEPRARRPPAHLEVFLHRQIGEDAPVLRDVA